jgi:TolB-like protein
MRGDERLVHLRAAFVNMSGDAEQEYFSDGTRRKQAEESIAEPDRANRLST